MLFNSIDFIYCFLPFALLIFWLLNFFKRYLSDSIIIIFLITISLIFYSYWNFNFAILMVGSVVVNWIVGEIIVNILHAVKKRIILVIGMSLNLLLLGYYKYYNFFVDNINLLGFSFSGFEDIILPIGISFYTFTQIGYLIDLYRNPNWKNYPLLKYLLFIIFFSTINSWSYSFSRRTYTSIPQIKFSL